MSVQYNAVQCSAVQYSTVQFSTVHTLNGDVSSTEYQAHWGGGQCARVRGVGGGASHGESICKHADSLLGELLLSGPQSSTVGNIVPT